MLLPLFFILSLLGSALTCWTLPVRNAWLILLFIAFLAAYFVACLVVYMLGLLIASLFLPKKEVPSKKHKAAFFIVRESCIAITKLARVRLRISGKELVPDEPFLLISNHRSNLDPIVTITALWQHPMAFLTKAGNMKIPVAGPFIKRADFLTINRKDPRKAIRTVNDAAMLIGRDQISYGVYPEGTRNKTDETLLPFHDGILRIAQKANVPIVVLTMQNTARIAKRFPFHSTTVPFDILRVYTAEEVANSRTTELSQEIRSLILSHLESADTTPPVSD